MEKDKLEILFRMNNFSEPSIKEEINKHGKVIKANKNDLLIREGQHLGFLPVVIDGKIRVNQEKEDREILLYNGGCGGTWVYAEVFWRSPGTSPNFAWKMMKYSIHI